MTNESIDERSIININKDLIDIFPNQILFDFLTEENGSEESQIDDPYFPITKRIFNHIGYKIPFITMGEKKEESIGENDENKESINKNTSKEESQIKESKEFTNLEFNKIDPKKNGEKRPVFSIEKNFLKMALQRKRRFPEHIKIKNKNKNKLGVRSDNIRAKHFRNLFNSIIPIFLNGKFNINKGKTPEKYIKIILKLDAAKITKFEWNNILNKKIKDIVTIDFRKANVDKIKDLRETDVKNFLEKKLKEIVEIYLNPNKVEGYEDFKRLKDVVDELIHDKISPDYIRKYIKIAYKYLLGPENELKILNTKEEQLLEKVNKYEYA